MLSPASDIRAELAAAVDEYQVHGNPAHLRARLREIAGAATPDALVAAVEPYREIPEVAGTGLRADRRRPAAQRACARHSRERLLADRSRSDVVGELASRAIAADATNRGAWHLWALSESDPRQRVTPLAAGRRPLSVGRPRPRRACRQRRVARRRRARHRRARSRDRDVRATAHDRAESDADATRSERALESLRGWKL